MARSVRLPAVAGSFYPAQAQDLRAALRACYEHPLGPGSSTVGRTPQPCALVAPHAGHIYSGPIAARAYALLPDVPPAAVVLVGPDHRGLGAPVSLSSATAWRTPFGDIPLARDLAEEVASRCPMAAFDDAAHEAEHALEVQVPFLQERYGDRAPIVPVLLAEQTWPICAQLGQAVADTLRAKDVLLVASSDWTHYAPRAVAERADRSALAPLLELDAAGFHAHVVRERVTSCGFGAVAAVLHAARILGAQRATLLGYATSADADGDERSVVGYAAVALYKI